MAKPQKKVNKKPLIWIGIVAVIAMALILTAVFFFMDSKEPENLSYQPQPTQAPLQSYYDPNDFVLDDNGFMTCLTRDYSIGIDVSSHQGQVDWQQVKDAGVEFVFIRVGRRGTTEGQIYTDELAHQNYAGAKEVGLKIGAYFFSQAVTIKEAEEEAWFVLKEIADWELPFFIGRIPVIYAAAKILAVVPLPLKSIRKNSNHGLSISDISRIGASHSSIMAMNLLPVVSTVLISVDTNELSIFTDG